MAEGLREAYHTAAAKNGALVADVGDRFLEMADTLVLYEEDSYHPSACGTRLAAQTLADVMLADWAKRAETDR